MIFFFLSKVTKSTLNDKKYCECCQNAIIKPGTTSYPNSNNTNYSTTNYTSTNSVNSIDSTLIPNYPQSQPNYKNKLNSLILSNSSKLKIYRHNTTRTFRKYFSFVPKLV